MVNDSEIHDGNLLLPEQVASTAGKSFAHYLKCWSEDLSSS